MATILHPYLERIKKSRGVLEDLTNEALILELHNGKIYAGLVDECDYDGGVVIALYQCKLLNQKVLKWVDHDFKVRRGSELISDVMPDFWVQDIRTIRGLREELRDKFYLDDVMQMYIDPHYRPIRGIRCDWNPGQNWENGRHETDCDVHLHEALCFIMTYPDVYAQSRETKWRRRFDNSFGYVRRRLLMYGAKIP